jgi:hypothetical protein
LALSGAVLAGVGQIATEAVENATLAATAAIFAMVSVVVGALVLYRGLRGSQLVYETMFNEIRNPEGHISPAALHRSNELVTEMNRYGNLMFWLLRVQVLTWFLGAMAYGSFLILNVLDYSVF